MPAVIARPTAAMASTYDVTVIRTFSSNKLLAFLAPSYIEVLRLQYLLLTFSTINFPEFPASTSPVQMGLPLAKMSSALCCKSQPSSSSPPFRARGVASSPLSNGVSRTHLPLPIKASKPSSMSSEDQAALKALFGHTKNAVGGENIELSKATFRQRVLPHPRSTPPSPGKFSVIKSRLKRQLSQRSSTLRGTSSEEQSSSKPGITNYPGPQSTTKKPYDADSWAYRTPEAGGYDRDAIVLRLSK